MKTHFVVTGIVKHKDKFLILKKAPNDYNYPNKWSFCSGFVKEFEAGEDTVIREIKEETSLTAKIIKTGKIAEVIDQEKQKRWVIAVYLCNTDRTAVKLCHENADFKWVKKEELNNYPFVPALAKDMESLGLD